MKRQPFALALLSLALFLHGCATAPSVLPPPEYRYEKGAIRISLTADPKLNLFRGSPHTLLVCFYHLRDPNMFNQLADEKEGLSGFLECANFDPSVVATKKKVVQPGQSVKESLDRAEGAKYIGVVAGYYDLQKENVSRLYPVPVFEESKGLVLREKTLKLAPLDIDLRLGAQKILDPKGQ